MTPNRDWRDPLLLTASPLDTGGATAVRCGTAVVGGVEALLVAWDFTVHGGSFSEADSTALALAVDTAIVRRLPLVTLLRSGGTRLTEGVRALVGIPRAVLALGRLRAAGLPHLSVADHPTTGGVWVAVGSMADIRVAVTGATVGFSGPRVVEAMTGVAAAEGALTAESAYDAGLVDLLLPAAAVQASLAAALRLLRPDTPEPVPGPAGHEAVRPTVPAAADDWTQVLDERTVERPDGTTLLAGMLPEQVPLRGSDPAVSAALGRLAGRRVVAVALAAGRGAMPGPGGFGLLRRAARLAGALDLGLVVLVDTPGADPHTEREGLAAAIGEAMQAVLDCQAPTVSLVHGAGGSGGALAGAVTDVVGVGEHGWFAALGPEGAATTLRVSAEQAARTMRVRPADLVEAGFAQQLVGTGDTAGWVAGELDRLRRQDPSRRLADRRTRWSRPLHGSS